jgi:hypothetical protein
MVRTDFIDFPTAWGIQREVGELLEHHPKCSSVPQEDQPLAGPMLLCDCAAMPTEWARRAIAQEPEREAEIRQTLQGYLPKHMRHSDEKRSVGGG